MLKPIAKVPTWQRIVGYLARACSEAVLIRYRVDMYAITLRTFECYPSLYRRPLVYGDPEWMGQDE